MNFGASDVIDKLAVVVGGCANTEFVAEAKLGLPKTNPEGATAGDESTDVALGWANMKDFEEGMVGLVDIGWTCDVSVFGSVVVGPGNPERDEVTDGDSASFSTVGSRGLGNRLIEVGCPKVVATAERPLGLPKADIGAEELTEVFGAAEV